MTQITIHINIGGRSYPASVNADNEIYIRKASKKINEQIKNYSARFPSTDVQDQLALAILDYMSQNFLAEDQRNNSEKQIATIVDEMVGMISSN